MPCLSNYLLIQYLAYPLCCLSNTLLIQYLAYPMPCLFNYLAYPMPCLSSTLLFHYFAYSYDSGLRGLRNLGSTCFMNVILQSMIHNPPLRAYFLSDQHSAKECMAEDHNRCLACQMDQLFTQAYIFHAMHSFISQG
jgi:ubiquitin C-terminal hydrolase